MHIIPPIESNARWGFLGPSVLGQDSGAGAGKSLFRVDVAISGGDDCDFRTYRIDLSSCTTQNHAQRVRLGNL